MALNKKLITFDKKDTFLGPNGINGATSPTGVSGNFGGYYGQIPSYSVVFIKDTGEIWSDGQYFGVKPKLFDLVFADNTDNGIVTYLADDKKFFRSSYNLWGHVLDGKTLTFDGPLYVTSSTEIANYTGVGMMYGRTGIKYVNRAQSTSLLSFTDSGGVTVPTGSFTVSTGNIETTLGSITAKTFLKGAYLSDTRAYYSAQFVKGHSWTSIKQFSASDASVSLATSRPAIITIQGSPGNDDWTPWITQGATDYASWAIGVGDSSFYIGRVSKSQTDNKLTHSWKFDSNGYLTSVGYKVIGKDDDYVVLAGGGTLAISEIKGQSELFSETIAPGLVLAGPTSGDYKVPSFRALVASDIPSLTKSKITDFGTYLTSIATTTDSGHTNDLKITTSADKNNTSYLTVPYASSAGSVAWTNVSDKVTVSTSASGIAPANSSANQADSASTSSYRFLGFDNAATPSLKWYTLPSNAFNNTTYSFYVGGANATANTAVSTSAANGTVYLTTKPSTSTTASNLFSITGDGGIIVYSDANGNIKVKNSQTSNVTTHLYVGPINTATTAAQSTNGNVYLKLYEGSEKGEQYQITGAGTVSVTSDANGNITITGSSHVTSLAYTAITGSGTTKDMALVSTTQANVLAFKQLGSNAFESHTIYDVVAALGATSITLKDDGWVTACTINNKDTGTYAIQISGTNILASGVFSIIKDNTDTQSDEIPLHNMGTGNPVFARTSGANLQVACTAAGAQTLIINIKRLI